MAREDKFTHMTRTPVRPLIVELAIPTIISMMVTGIYNSADTYFVGRISTQATGAVGVVFSVMAVIQAVGFFCGHGAGNYMSRQIGAGNRKEACETAATGFALAVLCGLALMCAGLLFLRPLARALGATPTMMDDTMGYMRIILCGAPVMISQILINNELRFQGSSIYAMAGLVSGALLNIGLDPLFIFVFGMGVAGAALATVLSQCVGLAILWGGTLRDENVRIEFQNIRLNGHYLFQIFNGGVPSLFRQGLSAVATIVLNHMAGAMGGDAAIAGMSVTTRVMMLVSSAVIGFGQGMQPVVSFNFGAKLYGRVKEAYRFCVKYATLFLLCMSAFCLAFSPSIIRFFRDDPEVVAVGAVALRYQASIMFVFGFTMMSNMLLQSVGKGVRASFLAACRSGIFFIPTILILSHTLGLRGVEMSQMVADLCSFVVTIPIVLTFWKELKE